MSKTFLGTSGWSYDEWVGTVYGTRNTPKLKYYSSVFSSVEIDSTFYAIPKKEMLSGWIRNTPIGFRFSAKLPQIITHKKKLEHVESDLIQFLQLLKPLSDAGKLGAVLIQLAPSFTDKSEKSLEEFFQIVPDDIPFAVEFRNKRWDKKETYKLLEKYKISSVATDSPLELNFDTTTDWTYIRYHGRGKKIWYDYKYSIPEISEFAKKLEKIQDKTKLVYGYFNNHYGGNAVENALQLIQVSSSLSSQQLELLNRFRLKNAELDPFMN